jgi:hypothetical protein
VQIVREGECLFRQQDVKTCTSPCSCQIREASCRLDFAQLICMVV